jgi:hypothetical protein
MGVLQRFFTARLKQTDFVSVPFPNEIQFELKPGVFRLLALRFVKFV